MWCKQLGMESKDSAGQWASKVSTVSPVLPEVGRIITPLYRQEMQGQKIEKHCPGPSSWKQQRLLVRPSLDAQAKVGLFTWGRILGNWGQARNPPNQGTWDHEAGL